MNLVDTVNGDFSPSEKLSNIRPFRPGDTVAVHARITEGNKTRLQVFQGTVIATKEPRTPNGHFRVRKVSSGIGVERVFPYFSPSVEKVEVVTRGKTRRSKLYYLRQRAGKKARVAIEYGPKKSASSTQSAQSAR